MTALLLLASALVLGAAAVRHLPLRLYAFEYVAMSVVVGLVGNPGVLGWILGRPPTDFETFARRVAAATG